MNNCNISSLNKIELLNEKIIEFLDFLNNIIKNMTINDNIEECNIEEYNIEEYNIYKNGIKKIKTQIKLGLLYDNSIVYDLCETNILKYKQDILNKNELVIYEVQIKLLKNEIKLYDMWKNIDNDDKLTIWKYLNVFVLLVE